MLFHPWRTLRALVHVTLYWHDGGPAGRTCFTAQTISLRRGLTQAERRSTLTHELRHIARGPFLSGYAAREEAVVDAEAARLLITFEALVDAMLWSRDEYELADQLWVDVNTVRARLEALTHAETFELNRRLDEAELRIP